MEARLRYDISTQITQTYLVPILFITVFVVSIYEQKYCVTNRQKIIIPTSVRKRVEVIKRKMNSGERRHTHNLVKFVQDVVPEIFLDFDNLWFCNHLICKDI